MKKFALLCCSIIFFTFSLLGCISDQNRDDQGKYTINGSVALGTVNNSLDNTKITYDITISGDKADIDNIDSQEPLINMDHLDLMLANGPHYPQIKGEDEPYLEVTGSFVFDTNRKSKEEIENMNFFEGIKIIDKDKNEFILIYCQGDGVVDNLLGQ